MNPTEPQKCFFCGRPAVPAPLPLRNDDPLAGDGEGPFFLCSAHTAQLAEAGIHGLEDPRTGVRWWINR